MTYILRTLKLTKSFKGVEALTNVSISVKKGEIYGLLGPNGAGKTTLMKLITNLIKPTAGRIELFDEELTNEAFHLNERMGSIIEKPVFYEKLSGKENLEMHCEYMGYFKEGAIEESLKLVGLDYIDDKKVGNYSLGMKQRLGIARAILTKPDLLILDEPIQGIDPEGIQEIRDLFKKLANVYGMTILISSHILSEIELVADRVGVIEKGVLVDELDIKDLERKESKFIEISCTNMRRALAVLDEIIPRGGYKIFEDKVRVYSPHVNKQEIIKRLMREGIDINSIENKSSSLEEYYLKMLKKRRNN